MMNVVSVNLSDPVIIQWHGKNVTTGIYKKPVNRAILLEAEAVKNDTVSDRRVHGGINKACYLYSADYYQFWKERYPQLDWGFGMFGENVTVSGMDEVNLNVGSIYQLGEALVQITQPRQPCFKLGVKFGDHKILREFIQFGHPGTYLRILRAGKVKSGDSFYLTEKAHEKSIKETFELLYK